MYFLFFFNLEFLPKFFLDLLLYVMYCCHHLPLNLYRLKGQLLCVTTCNSVISSYLWALWAGCISGLDTGEGGELFLLPLELLLLNDLELRGVGPSTDEYFLLDRWWFELWSEPLGTAGLLRTRAIRALRTCETRTCEIDESI